MSARFGGLFFVPYNGGMLSWSQRRKFLYTTAAGFVTLIVLAFVYQTFFTAAATCFDNKQNGDEHGIDCGGSCSLICPGEAHAPRVLWSRIFQTGASTYTAAAYVENDNPGAGARRVPYSFQIFDADNQLVIERDGVIDLPPVQTIAIVEPNLSIPNRQPARALFSFGAVPVWHAVAPQSVPALRVSGQQLAADGSRLSATLANGSLAEARSVTIGAVLFDASGTAQAASKSTVSVPAKSSVPVVFTFPGGVSGIVRAEITVLPPF
jgi:hypothetical protein